MDHNKSAIFQNPIAKYNYDSIADYVNTQKEIAKRIVKNKIKKSIIQMIDHDSTKNKKIDDDQIPSIFK